MRIADCGMKTISVRHNQNGFCNHICISLPFRNPGILRQRWMRLWRTKSAIKNIPKFEIRIPHSAMRESSEI
jgi:hypothetical protein